MSKIETIIKNLEIIKSRDSANHKEDCKCELCDSLRLSKLIDRTIISSKRLNKKMGKMIKSGPEEVLLAYIEFFMERL